MTRKVRKHGRRSSRPLSMLGILAAFVALLFGAQQSGIVDLHLPAVLANPAIPSEGSDAGTGMALGTTAGASDANCAGQFLDGKAPVLINAKLDSKTHKLCYTGFAVLDSGVTRTPLWAAEHLTAARMAAAQTLARKDSFHADANLPADDRAELKDYKGYPFDRGHMAPNADMPDAQSQQECFTLANIVPQDKDDNEGLWRRIEQSVRELAEQDGDVYVVSGPIFDGDSVEQIHDRVMVPTHLFKAVYDVARHEAAAYVVENAPGDEYRTITITELRTMTGIDVFPDLPESATTAELKLPALSGHKG